MKSCIQKYRGITIWDLGKKHFCLLTAGLLVLSMGRAQIKKGDVLLGGTLEVIRHTETADVDVHSTNINVSPSVGKAIGDNLVLGVNLLYLHSGSKQPGGTNPLYILNGNNYGLGVFLRRYHDLGHAFSIFLEGNLQGTFGRQKGNYEGVNGLWVDSKGYSVNAGLYGGVAYNITRHWQLETGFQNLAYVNYAHTKDNGMSAGGRKTSSYSLGTSFNNALNNFVIGCKWILD